MRVELMEDFHYIAVIGANQFISTIDFSTDRRVLMCERRGAMAFSFGTTTTRPSLFGGAATGLPASGGLLRPGEPRPIHRYAPNTCLFTEWLLVCSISIIVLSMFC